MKIVREYKSVEEDSLWGLYHYPESEDGQRFFIHQTPFGVRVYQEDKATLVENGLEVEEAYLKYVRRCREEG